MPFAELLGAIAAVPGIERIRYTSPHPIFFDEALIRAHGELPALCPHVHLPVAERLGPRARAHAPPLRPATTYAGSSTRLRAARPDIALTTDLIVGFPGETDADFEATLALVRDVGFVGRLLLQVLAAAGHRRAQRAARTRLDARRGPGAPRASSRTCSARSPSPPTGARVGEPGEVLVEGPSRHGDAQLTGRDP